MGEPRHEIPPADGIAAVLLAAVVGAGLALYLRDRNYSPVEEAQRIARKALGIED